MVASKFSISLSEELAAVVRRLAAERGEDVSRLIEILLRENALVQDAVRRRREAPPPPDAKGEPAPRADDRGVRVGVSVRTRRATGSARSSKGA